MTWRSVLIVVVVLVLAVIRSRRRRAHSARTWRGLDGVSSGVGLVAVREIRERVRSRIFKVGTVVVLAVVAVAIIIPAVKHSTPQPERVGVVGTPPAPFLASLKGAAASVGMSVRIVVETSRGAADTALRQGRIDVALVGLDELVLNHPLAASDTSQTAQFVSVAATDLGVLRAMFAARLTSGQIAQLFHSKPLPVRSVGGGVARGSHNANPTSIIGIVLIFLMLSQYDTWILIGVMEEKSSRVIEVLLASLRPIQLLAGKVLGIGLVALFQAALITAVALGVGKATGSDIVSGTQPLALASTLVWLVAGYAFYSWVYAAAGSMAERQDQVQTLAFPLALPMVFGYISAITAASSGTASTFIRVLGFLPPTAPFAMPVLVGLHAVSGWEFALSLIVSVVATIGVARVAASIYRRAILRTGQRVRWRDVLSRSAAH